MHIKSKNEEKINTPQISDYRDHSSLIEHLKKVLKGIPRAKKKMSVEGSSNMQEYM